MAYVLHDVGPEFNVHARFTTTTYVPVHVV